MEERYHATTQNRFSPAMSNVNKNVTMEANLISPPTYNYIFCASLLNVAPFFAVFSFPRSWTDNSDVLTRNRPYPFFVLISFSCFHSSSVGWSSTSHNMEGTPSQQAYLDRWLTLLE